MELRTGRTLSALGLTAALASLHVLTRDLLPPGFMTGLCKAIVLAFAVWALVIWTRPRHRK